MPSPRSGERHIVLPLSVGAYVHPSHFVVTLLVLSPQLLLQYLMQGLETCNMVQTCIEYLHKGNRILIQVFIVELCPLEWHTRFDHITLSTVCVSATPPTVFDAGI